MQKQQLKSCKNGLQIVVIFFLSKLDWIEKSIDSGNHEAYRIAFNQLKTAIENQKNTLDKVHDLLIYEADK
ncbi:hypothetical protein [Acinetobacter junii]|uniref:hypothetical protein n=1 Tax=Acinetobacter junii TaxID=40215 RepID=UPI001F1EB931|nr:hypothetical protein [Acinetobacter junii]